MRTRFAWIAGILVLVSIGALMACSDKYTSHSDALVVVSTYTGDAVMETFSLDLGNGQMTQINNVNGPPTAGAATVVLLDPPGAYAYVLLSQNSTVIGGTGIARYPVNSDGTLGASLGTFTLSNTQIVVNGQTESIPVAPVAMAMDSAGKFLFVADAQTSDSAGNAVPGTVSVLAIGSNASLTEVSSSASETIPFPIPVQPGGQPADPSALAVTPTVYPVLDAPCTAHTPPTTEDLYVTDLQNYLVFNYLVSSTGSLSLVPTGGSTQGIPTGAEPNGVTVDPCNRFVYVGNSEGSSVSAYTICSAVSLPECQYADYSLLPVAGSPFKSGDGAGPLTVDAYAHFLYVLATKATSVYAYNISATNGALTPMTPNYVGTGAFPTSIAIRSDDSFMVVTNLNAASLSEFGVTPGDGALTVQPTVPTFNYPWGVALK
jgi:6-phosphogluconolactonase (cycloisomerase 2 family)